MKKRTFKHIDFEGELEGTNISLKIHDLTCRGTEMRAVNIVTEDFDYLLSLKEAGLENMALAITDRKTKKTGYYYVMLKPVTFKISD